MASNTGFSGSVPENYDRYLGPLLFEPFARDLIARIDIAVSGDILEIACGTGRLTRHLRSALPDARIAALDLNPDMIAVARPRLADAAIQWQTGDAQDLPYPTGSFDLVICQFGIMFMPDKAKALTQFLRVLRPGGKLLFNSWNTITTNEVVYTASETINQFFPDDPPTFYQSPFSLHDDTLIESLVRQAGFFDISVKLVKLTGSSPSAAEAAIGLVEGSPVIGFILEKAPGKRAAIREKVEKEIAARFGSKPLQSSLEAWVIQASKK
jgi:ubiquinone/menaquinone biosynthesis C-methylase UbiE